MAVGLKSTLSTRILIRIPHFSMIQSIRKLKQNQLIEGHRKIDYISVLDEAEMANNDHGTHTAGSITGKALNDESNEAKYNGCAPNSRLSFYSSTYRDFIPDEINKVCRFG